MASIQTKANIIAFNNFGVAIWDSGTDNNAVLGNSIFRNDGLGIEIQGVGVNANDTNDTDTGANDDHEYAGIHDRLARPASTTVNFDLDTNQSGNYRIEFFVSDLADATGSGEGQTLVHSEVISHTGGGVESFAAVFATSANAVISATATEDFGGSYGSTSEFSMARNAQGGYVLVVDTTSDVFDGNTSSIANLLNDRGADGFISLREAILASNAELGTTELVQFAITEALVGGAHTIDVGNVADGNHGALPDIIGAIIIDGTTDSDFTGTPIIGLNGTDAGAVDGLTLAAGSDGSTIRGLVINRFGEAGMKLIGSDDHTIVGNYIGTDAAGTGDLGNTQYGIELNNSGSNQIGGSTAADRNVVSGNGYEGISLWNSGSTLNVIQGNYIGVDSTGNAGLGNSRDGIVIGGGANHNTIGGDRTVGEGNVISGQIGATSDGIEIDNAGADNNLIYGNYIGTNFDGTTAIGNARYGIVIYNGVQGTQVGGTGTGQGNIISGNNDSGIVIDGNGVATTSGNVIQANYIGTDVTGTIDLGNIDDGIRIFAGAQSNTVGGTAAGAGNLISGNGGDGIDLLGTNSNTIEGNLIGTDVTGTVDLGNTGKGVRVASAAEDNIIGGTTAGARNLISGNDGDGIRITVGSLNNQVLGNYIGTDLTGTVDLGNSGYGVLINSAAISNTIGGTAAGAGNLISGNDTKGVGISGLGTDGNVVQGNYVGTDVTGTADLGNTGTGIWLASSAAGNTIGGSRGRCRQSGRFQRCARNRHLGHRRRGQRCSGQPCSQ